MDEISLFDAYGQRVTGEADAVEAAEIKLREQMADLFDHLIAKGTPLGEIFAVAAMLSHTITTTAHCVVLARHAQMTAEEDRIEREGF